MVELLLAHGASVDQTLANVGVGVSGCAVASPHPAPTRVSWLLRYSYAQVRGATPLLLASWLGHAEVVRVLLSRGAGVDSAMVRRAVRLCNVAVWCIHVGVGVGVCVRGVGVGVCVKGGGGEDRGILNNRLHPGCLRAPLPWHVPPLLPCCACCGSVPLVGWGRHPSVRRCLSGSPACGGASAGRRRICERRGGAWGTPVGAHVGPPPPPPPSAAKGMVC